MNLGELSQDSVLASKGETLIVYDFYSDRIINEVNASDFSVVAGENTIVAGGNTEGNLSIYKNLELQIIKQDHNTPISQIMVRNSIITLSENKMVEYDKETFEKTNEETFDGKPFFIGDDILIYKEGALFFKGEDKSIQGEVKQIYYSNDQIVVIKELNLDLIIEVLDLSLKEKNNYNLGEYEYIDSSNSSKEVAILTNTTIYILGVGHINDINNFSGILFTPEGGGLILSSDDHIEKKDILPWTKLVFTQGGLQVGDGLITRLADFGRTRHNSTSDPIKFGFINKQIVPVDNVKIFSVDNPEGVSIEFSENGYDFSETITFSDGFDPGDAGEFYCKITSTQGAYAGLGQLEIGIDGNNKPWF